MHSAPPIGVYKPCNVVFTQVATRLHFNKLKVSLAGILKSVLDAQRYVGALVFCKQDFFFNASKKRGAFDHNSVLCAVVVHLQAELDAWAHGDALDLMPLTNVHAVVSAPRAGNFAVLD